MQLKNNYLIFYLVCIFLIIIVSFSNPFLRYPYDMIHHLIVIDEFYIKLEYPIQKLTGIWAHDLYVLIPTGETEPIVLSQSRYLWHYIWATFFVWTDIDSTQLFLRAKIIHIIQTLISFSSIYYFSNVVLRNIFNDISTSDLRWFSLWSVLIWLTIFATFSVAYQQVWIMWYSVTYQISLPLFWYILGLTLVLLLEENSWKIKLFFLLQILIISRFILQVHAMEFMYYMMHIAVFSVVFIDKVYIILKKYYYLIIPTLVGIGYFATQYRPASSPIFKYLSFEKLPELYEKIMQNGIILLNGYNRALASINELMYVIEFSGILFLIYLLYVKYYSKKETSINIRMLIFVALTSLFVFIPLYQFSSGLFALLTYTMVVNRLYYSASLFLVLPIVVYGILSSLKIRTLYMNIIIITILLAVGIFSKYNNILNHNYYKNLKSIKNSFNENKVGFHLNSSQIEIIKQQLESYEKSNISAKEIRYFARADIAFVLKYLFHKKVYWKGRSRDIDYLNAHKKYKQYKDNQKYKNILFETPEKFPSYRPYS